MVEIIHEDSDILVVNKPAGMIVHPAPGHETGTLTDEVTATRPEMRGVGSEERPGIVHRLDTETSGVMVLAKNAAAYRELRRQFEGHAEIEKRYLAIVHGTMEKARGTIRTQIGRKAWDAKRMAVVEEGGKDAVTHWETLGRKGRLSLVEFRIETGRMHQIRVHAAYMGHPIAGDRLYGDREADRRMTNPARRQLLHAVMIAFRHPRSGERVEFSAEVPGDIVYAR